jgi:hypothetical protein
MKRRRRVEFEIERNEISIFAASGAPANPRSASTSPPSSGLLHVQPLTCPNCGTPDMLLLTDYVAASETDLSTLQQRISDGTLHLHCTPAGEWWVCTQSFHRS